MAPNPDESVLLSKSDLKYFDGTRRGYCFFDVTPERFQCDWCDALQILIAADGKAPAAFVCNDDTKRRTRCAQTMPIATAPPLEP